MGAELFVWDATLHTVSDVRLEYTGAGQLKMNSKWKHACAFTDIEVSGGMYWCLQEATTVELLNSGLWDFLFSLV